MKELSIEEKAERYDEAIIRAKSKINNDKDHVLYEDDVIEIFPELKESEDERISEQNNNEDADILHRFSFYSYKDEPNILYLAGLYVNEEYRNKGIGTKILEVTGEVAKSLNCHTIRLKTKKDSNAERLYRTHGYNSLTTEDSDEIWLEKQGEQKSIDDLTQQEAMDIAVAKCFEQFKSNVIMKANELMIDDWVYNKNIGKPIQVYPMMFSQMFRQKPDATTEDYNIFPILITPEILEKNGFRKSVSPPGIHAKCYEINNKDEKYCLTIADYNKYKRLLLNIDAEDSECFNIKCDYVHQLQHALKLCGIEKEIKL